MAGPSLQQKLKKLLRPCAQCGGLEFRVSRETYLSRFRAVVCAECGRTTRCST